MIDSKDGLLCYNPQFIDTFVSFFSDTQVLVYFRDRLCRSAFPLQVYMSFGDFLCELRTILSNKGNFSEYPSDYVVSIVGFFSSDGSLHSSSEFPSSIRFKEFSLLEFKSLFNSDFSSRTGCLIDFQSNSSVLAAFLRQFATFQGFSSEELYDRYDHASADL